MNGLSSETSIEFVVPVPQSILWLGGILAAMLLGGLVTVVWLFASALP
jgi:hypothetical protein